VLTNVTVDAQSLAGGTGIGVGSPRGQLNSLQLSGTSILNSNSNSVDHAVNATSIVIADASLVFETNGTCLFGSSPSKTGLIELAIFYHMVTVKGEEPLSELETVFLQIGNLSIPEDEKWTFCLSNGTYERCIGAPSDDVKSIVVSIPRLGNYSIQAFTDSRRGHLECDGNAVFHVNSNVSFFQIAVFVPVRSISPPPTPQLTPTDHPTLSVQFSQSNANVQSRNMIASMNFGLSSAIAPSRQLQQHSQFPSTNQLLLTYSFPLSNVFSLSRSCQASSIGAVTQMRISIPTFAISIEFCHSNAHHHSDSGQSSKNVFSSNSLIPSRFIKSLLHKATLIANSLDFHNTDSSTPSNIYIDSRSFCNSSQIHSQSARHDLSERFVDSIYSPSRDFHSSVKFSRSWILFMSDTRCQSIDLNKSPSNNHSWTLVESKILRETVSFTKSENAVPTITVGMSIRIAVSQNQIFVSEMGISSSFSFSQNIIQSEFRHERTGLSPTSVVLQSSSNRHSPQFRLSDNLKQIQNVMTSTDILTQTVQYSSSGIGEATPTMIQSKLIASFNFSMTNEISSTFADQPEQSSFGIIEYVAISGSLAALATVVVIVLILLRRRNASESISKFSNRVNGEQMGESATEMDYDTFLDQPAFENPSSSRDNLMVLFATPSSNTEELF
jgi:hypothetical protein